MADVSSVNNLLATANEGFITTLSATVSSGAATVPLTNVTGLANGSVFVGIVEPGDSKEQVFTGTVDTGGAKIINVVWTKGSNVSHAGGSTVVDYITSTGFNMLTSHVGTEHKQDGTHSSVTADSVTATGSVNADSISTGTSGQLVFSTSQTQPTAISGKTIIWFKPTS